MNRLSHTLGFVAIAAFAVGCSAGVDTASDAPGTQGDEPPRGALGKADGAGSCQGPEGDLCGGPGSGVCYCDDQCEEYGDCCADYASVCGGATVVDHFNDDTGNTDLGYAIGSEAEGVDCDLYVDSFGILRVSAYYHAGSSSLLIDLQPPASANVLNAGMSLVMDERVTKNGEVLSDESGRDVKFAFGQRDGSLFRGKLVFSSDSTDGTEARRTVRQFAFFADVEENGAVRRIWNRPASGAYTPADYDNATYYYSDPVPYDGQGGTANVSYLWRDSGSPVFSARNGCLGL